MAISTLMVHGTSGLYQVVKVIFQKFFDVPMVVEIIFRAVSNKEFPNNASLFVNQFTSKSTGAEFSECKESIGLIYQCFYEGNASLPSPVKDFKAINVTDGKVFLDWESVDANMIDHYEVFYKETDNKTNDSEVFSSDMQINSNMPFVKISDLEVGKLYRFFVVARNDHGSSLPSAIITLNVSSAAYQDNKTRGTT